MEFWKMNGNGNDFLVFDARGQSVPWSVLAPRLCARRSGLGADGLLLFADSSEAPFAMRLFNADGSEAEMCGNGARCMARYAFDRGLAPREMTFSTLAGPIRASVSGAFVELVMTGFKQPEEWRDRTLRLGGETWRCSWVDTGVPHLVLCADEMPDRDTCFRVGRLGRNETSLFPRGTNVTFAVPLGRGEVQAWTYERGVEDLTDSCGTGCVAAALVMNRFLGMGPVMEVANLGGVNRVTLTEGGALLGGKTVVAARGTVGSDLLN